MPTFLHTTAKCSRVIIETETVDPLKETDVDIGNPDLKHLGSECNVSVDWAKEAEREMRLSSGESFSRDARKSRVMRVAVEPTCFVRRAILDSTTSGTRHPRIQPFGGLRRHRSNPAVSRGANV